MSQSIQGHPLAALPEIAAGRDFLTTEEAARALNRKPQTLHKWAMTGAGPVRPVRQFGRLGWPVTELAHVLAGGRPMAQNGGGVAV